MADEEGRKAKQANQTELRQGGKKQAMLQSKAASCTDLFHCVAEVLRHDFLISNWAGKWRTSQQVGYLQSVQVTREQQQKNHATFL